MAARARLATERKITNRAQPQQMELLHTYQALGMEPEDARTVVIVFSKYKDIMIDEKMTAQERMLPPPPNREAMENESVKFTGACVLSALSLALLGLAKAKIAGQKYILTVAVTLFNGAIADSSAYLIGWTLRHVAGGLQD
ncbi:hypothetical protein AAC387_Pa06g0654 [Persea americana]